jgi:hypothetical protein
MQIFVSVCVGIIHNILQDFLVYSDFWVVIVEIFIPIVMCLTPFLNQFKPVSGHKKINHSTCVYKIDQPT